MPEPRPDSRPRNAELRPLAPWLVILAVGIFDTHGMWAPATLWGHSAWFDFTRLIEFDAAIRGGDLLPSWSPDLYHGYGSPLFQFYSPLVYYVAEIFVLAGFGIPIAFKITFLLTLLASGAAMYQLAAAHHSRAAACFGAMLYMVAPYRIVDLFVRHALAEHAAFLWLPWIVLGTERFVARRSPSGLLLGSLAVAGLILTHNVMALIGIPICVAAGWFLSGRGAHGKTFFYAALPASIATGLTAFFWWPALYGRGLTCAESSLTSGYFDYHRHFVAASSLLRTDWGFGETGFGPAEIMPLQLGLPHAFLGGFALAIMFGRGRTRWSMAGVIILLGSLFMCLPISEPVWTSLPLLKYVQFPWRFLGLAVLGGAGCGASVFEGIATKWPQRRVPIFGIALAVVLAAYFPYYSAVRFLAVDGRAGSIELVTAEGVETMRANRSLLSLGDVITREKIREVGERATSSDDFLPSGVQEKPAAPAPQPIAAVTGEIRHADRLRLNEYRANIFMPAAGRVELHQFWFPGWHATVDGQIVNVMATGKSALVSCDVPAGEHVVDFRYVGTPQRRAATAISLLSLILGIVATLRFAANSPRKTAS